MDVQAWSSSGGNHSTGIKLTHLATSCPKMSASIYSLTSKKTTYLNILRGDDKLGYKTLAFKQLLQRQKQSSAWNIHLRCSSNPKSKSTLPFHMKYTYIPSYITLKYGKNLWHYENKSKFNNISHFSTTQYKCWTHAQGAIDMMM
jgi:hypothetical protein